MLESRESEFSRLISLIRPCTMCNIPPPAYPIVSGKFGAKVMSVGQSPGLIECREGKPFAGTAGTDIILHGWPVLASSKNPSARMRT